MLNKNIFLLGLFLLTLSVFSGTANAADYTYEDCRRDGGDIDYCERFNVAGDEGFFGSGANSAEDCGPGFVFSNGQCIDEYNYAAEGSCEKDSQCGNGFECYQNRCVDDDTYEGDTSWYNELFEGTTDVGGDSWDFLFGEDEPAGSGGGSGGDGTGTDQGENGQPYAPGEKCGGPDSGFTEVAGVCMPGKELTGGLSEAGVLDIMVSLLSWLFALFSILAIMAFVISGIQYLVSAGDTGMIDTAKKNMKWSVVGIIVGFSGFIVLKAVAAALAGSPIF